MNSLIRWTELNKLLICLSSDFPKPAPELRLPVSLDPSQHLGLALPSSLGHVETLQKVEAPDMLGNPEHSPHRAIQIAAKVQRQTPEV
jgi:hypothetical protein